MPACSIRRRSTFRSGCRRPRFRFAWRLPMPANLLADLIRFLPETILTVMGTLLMVLDPILRKRSSHAFGHLSLVALLAAIGGTFYARTMAGPGFGGLLMVDDF